MPSILSHPAPALALALGLGTKIMPPRLAAFAVLCSVLPDLDVLGFGFGVRYGEVLGHRGLSHSLVLALTVALLGWLAAPALKSKRPTAFLTLFFVTASHGALDAMTSGGLGVALFWPFDDARHFFPWRPIQVSPFGVRNFLSERGLRVIQSELRWIWAPCLGFVLACRTFRLLFRGRK